MPSLLSVIKFFFLMIFIPFISTFFLSIDSFSSCHAELDDVCFLICCVNRCIMADTGVLDLVYFYWKTELFGLEKADILCVYYARRRLLVRSW